MVAVPFEAAQEAVGVQVADVQLREVKFRKVRAEGLVFTNQGSTLEGGRGQTRRSEGQLQLIRSNSRRVPGWRARIGNSDRNRQLLQPSYNRLLHSTTKETEINTFESPLTIFVAASLIGCTSEVLHNNNNNSTLTGNFVHIPSKPVAQPCPPPPPPPPKALGLVAAVVSGSTECCLLTLCRSPTNSV